MKLKKIIQHPITAFSAVVGILAGIWQPASIATSIVWSNAGALLPVAATLNARADQLPVLPEGSLQAVVLVLSLVFAAKQLSNVAKKVQDKYGN